MLNYFYDCYTILNKVYSDKTYLKQAISSTFIEEKNRALTVKTCYGVLDKDIELSYYLSHLAQKTPKLVIRTVLKIAMYAIKYLNKQGYAVTKNAVELVKKLGKGGMSGFVNATIRKFINSDIPLPTEQTEYLSVKYSYPQFAVKELIKSYGVERAEKIISVENGRTCLSFYEVDGEKYLKNLGITYQETPFKNVFYAEKFVRNDDYDKGLYTYQALGSVAICDVVSPCENLLDCCAAPGGKSIRLSYKCDNITAWDVHEHRVSLIEDYAFRMKRGNVKAFYKDAKVLDKNLEESFDAVLCDAPCSGLGVLNDNPDMKLQKTLESVIELNNEQLSILKTVCKYVKIGGYLYYSTCSVLSRENIEIIKRFMCDINGYILEQISSDLPHENIDGTLQFLPDISDGLGFYVAKLKRVK